MGLFINGALLWSWCWKESLAGTDAGDDRDSAVSCIGNFTVYDDLRPRLD